MVVIVQKYLYSDESGCIWARWLSSGKVVVFGKKWLYSGKGVVFRQSCCVREKFVVIGQKWLYSGKIGSIRVYIRAK